MSSQDKAIRFIDSDYRELMPGSGEDRLMFYRNDDDGGRCVGWLRGDFGRSGVEFHHGWTDRAAEQNTPEFKAELQEVMTMLRRDILKDHAASIAYCHAHPEAKLPDRDGHYYGFKLETETRQYFVRCTTLRNDYFYVFAYNKPSPLRAQEKPSVLEQLREGKKQPSPPRDADEKNHTRSKHGPTL